MATAACMSCCRQSLDANYAAGSITHLGRSAEMLQTTSIVNLRYQTGRFGGHDARRTVVAGGGHKQSKTHRIPIVSPDWSSENKSKHSSSDTYNDVLHHERKGDDSRVERVLNDQATIDGGVIGRSDRGNRRRAFLAASTCLCTALIGCKVTHADSFPGGEALCSQCHGSGAVPCNLCGGTGQWRQGFQNGIEQTLECPQCSGRGQLKCVRCLGTGLGDTGGLLRGAAVKEGHMRVRADGSIEILDCDYFPATRGKDCRPSVTDNRITEDRALSAPRGGLYPRPDLVDIAKKTWRIVEGSLEK